MDELSMPGATPQIQLPPPAARASDAASTLWERFLAAAQAKVSAHVYGTFFVPMHPRQLRDGVLHLEVADAFLQDWISSNYRRVLQDELSALAGAPIDIELSVNSELRQAAPAAPEQTGQSATGTPSEMRPGAAPGEEPLRGARALRLNGHYRFDSFVRGPSNDFALAAAIAVADHPAERYNPLFIFGGVGLGKTHLLHAIGHRILERRPAAHIVYTSSEEFVNEVVNAMQLRNPRDFYTKYREHCDVLLMDDIQLIAGKERTQHEFFHIFNILHNSHRQIVVTSDKLPHEIPDMEERLRSRFQCGLIADIHEPELETRVAILKRKAESDGHPLPNEVAFYIAEQIPSNVRKLEGALTRLLAHAALTGRPLTVEYTAQILGDILGPRRRLSTVEDVQQAVADFYHLRVSELCSSRRHLAVTRPRQVAMYICRKHLKTSYPQLAERFGGRDHTTVISACRKVETLLAIDSELAGDVATIEKKMQG